MAGHRRLGGEWLLGSPMEYTTLESRAFGTVVELRHFGVYWCLHSWTSLWTRRVSSTTMHPCRYPRSGTRLHPRYEEPRLQPAQDLDGSSGVHYLQGPIAVWEQARLCRKSVVKVRIACGVVDLRALRWQLSALSDLTTDGQREVMITLCFWGTGN